MAEASITSGVRRGAFFVLEGLDRSGKTSTATALVDTLNKEKPGSAVQMNFPDRKTPIGVMIDAYLKNSAELDDRVVHLLFSANRFEKQAWIRAQLAKGVHVICDRYAYSGIAFTTAKIAMANETEWAAAPDRGLVAPDLVLYFNVSAEEAAKRGGFGNERYEKREMQDRVRDRFEEMLANSRQSVGPVFGSGVHWTVIDANQALDKVQADALVATKAILVSATLSDATRNL